MILEDSIRMDYPWWWDVLVLAVPIVLAYGIGYIVARIAGHWPLGAVHFAVAALVLMPLSIVGITPAVVFFSSYGLAVARILAGLGYEKWRKRQARLT